MASDILFFNAKYTSNGFLYGLRALSRSPRQHFSVSILGDGDRRLHRSMREMRSIVFRLDDLAALGKFRVHVAQIAHHLPRLTRRGFQSLAEWIGIVNRVRTGVPIDLECLAPLECGPGVVGDDGDAAQRLEVMRRFEGLNGQRLLHAAYFQSTLVVIGFDFLSEDR